MKKLIYIFLVTPIILIGQEYLTYNHNGINRDYIYYEPVGLPDNAPLVIVAHGYSDSHTSIMNYSGMNVIANQNGFAVCYPKGTTDNQWGGQNFWNVGYDFHEGYSVNDIDFLINLAQHLQATYNLSAENTFMTGMSNGAELCYLIACEAPGFFKAFAPVAGTIFPNGLTNNSCTNFSVPFFEIHGSNDDVTLFEGDANDQFWGPYLSIDSIINLWIDINGISGLTIDTIPNFNTNNKFTVSYKYTSSIDSNEFWLYKHKDGHSWSVDDIIVEQEIWSFFSKYLTSDNPINLSESNIKSNKLKIKTFDLLGRISQDKLYAPLIDIYDDGSSHKRIVID